MKIILLGAPGVGKGTQAQFIVDQYRIPQISTGDMLRGAIKVGSELGKRVKKVMDKGLLVTDQIIIDLVKEQLSQLDCSNGFLLDGFPRTIPQAEAMLEAGISIDYALEIKVSETEIIKRLSGRRIHLGSGRVYHVDYNPPRVADKDDETGEPLVQRNDDKLEAILERLRVYREQTKPLVEFYQNLAKQEIDRVSYIVIEGLGTTDDIKRKIFAILDEYQRGENVHSPINGTSLK